MTRNDLRRARRRCATVTVLAALVAVAGTGYAPDNARAAGTQPRVSIADVLIGEGDGVVSVRVSLSERSASAVSMRYSMPNGNATGDVFGRPGFDFLARHGVTLTFAPGQRTKTIRIPILDDPDDEGLETFFVRLDSAMNATIANGEAAVSIVDNEPRVARPRLVARSVIVDEKDGMAHVPVLLGGPAGQASKSTVTVRYATANGSAIARSDYSRTSGELTFTPGESVKHVPIVINDDDLAEGAETLSLELSAATNATIATTPATVRIGASDGRRASLPRVSIADVRVGEGEGWTHVVVSLSARSASAVSMRYSMPNGNATGDVFGRPGFDFLARHGVTLTFAPGQRTKTIRIPILDDPDDEGLETFFVRLDSAMNATIANGMAAVRIRDND